MIKRVTAATVSLSLVTGCADPRFSLVDRSIPSLEIDLENGLYDLRGHIRRLENCGTDDFHCLVLEHIGTIAMHRRCSDYSGEFSVPSISGTFRMYAPAPHLASPAGSFYNSEQRNILFLYNGNDGVHQINIYESGVGEAGFESDRPAARYRIVLEDGSTLFSCE